ncbi:ATP-binding cassette domain-containing protein [Gallibacterium salpingitidis]|uniref:ATP-binding cassette domain-containing protein n=1 Tax=Gallibacterium salpingitidis TaxID=505341 RepID=UPI00266EA65A|nr:ATP-binding cassette domain-containing protein [Gallibacterium salpingitidis]WKS99758.1 ATP-binding cassette domain-containing protein [Gallibacterium salpingitidis]
MTQPIVVIDSVSKHFKGMDTLALDHISAQIYPGKITGLVGPDGAGKTTLIRHLIGLMQPDSGTITVDHFDIVNQCEGPHKMRNKINRELVGKNWNKRVKKLGMTRLDVISSLFL